MNDPYANDETPWRDVGVLKTLFVEKGMNTYEIADELDTTPQTVQKWLDKHGLRERSTINKDRPWQDEARMRELYVERKLTAPKVADELDCAHRTVLCWLDKHGIDKRDRTQESARTRRKKPPWHHFSEDGYEMVETEICGTTKQARIHRLVAVAECGFNAVSGNIVHHRNGMPADNRPGNLKIMSAEKHGELHKPVEVRWDNRKPIESHHVPGGGDTDA
jgi:transposase-like protein